MRGRPAYRASGVRALFLALAATIAVGCSLNDHAASYSTSLSQSTPNTVLYNFSTTTIRGKEPYFRIEAQRAETFDKKNVTMLEGVKFEEFNSQGKVIASGSADTAVYHTDTENAELSGHIQLYSDSEQARITAE